MARGPYLYLLLPILYFLFYAPFSLFSARAPAPGTLPAPDLLPVPVPAPALDHAPASVPATGAAPAYFPAPVSAPVSAPAHALDLASASVPSPALLLVPASVPAPAPAPVPAPALALCFFLLYHFPMILLPITARDIPMQAKRKAFIGAAVYSKIFFTYFFNILL